MTTVDLYINRNSNYPIIIGNNLKKNILYIMSLIKDNKDYKNIFLITNLTLFKLYYQEIKLIFKQELEKQIAYFIISDKEKNKNIEIIRSIFDFALKKKYGKDTLVISLGGGVIGDITGFFSSMYSRGLDHLSMPTTLLSQVDAAIGGKNGVNSLYGKNCVGTIYQPTSVIVYTNFLFSLSTESLKEGLAEIIKYAIVFDQEFFYWIVSNINNIVNYESKYLEYCIKKCCIYKTQIIQNDELEIDEKRILLNLGHTYAHALETYFNYNKFTHGEAVSIGIILSMYTSHILGLISYQEIKEVKNLLNIINLPTVFPKNIDINKYLEIISSDKKIKNNKLTLILPKKIGEAQISRNITLKLIFDTIEYSKKINIFSIYKLLHKKNIYN